MNVVRYLSDLKDYCEFYNINFKDMPKNVIKSHIRKMCKEIAHKTNLKK